MTTWSFKQKVCVAIVLLIAIILFISSSMTYQQQTSVPFLEKYLTSQPFKTFLSQISFNYAGSTVSIAHLGYYKFVEFFIRKGAHFGTYFLMGGFLYAGLPFIKKWPKASLSLAWCFLYASFDEFHQMLTGGRTPLIADVLLDSFGALVAISCLMIYSQIKQKR